MPVLNPNTPSVTVSVPVPTPVAAPKKARTPVSFGPPPQAPQPAPAPAPQPQQPVPGPRAIIFPWSPTPDSKAKLRRLPSKVVRYAADHSQVTTMLNTLASPEHANTRRGGVHPDADHLRGVLADALQDHGRDEEANHLRGRGPVFVQDGTVRPLPRHIEVFGRRWFQRGNGNTYHSVHAYVDGKHVLSVPYEYGYGSQYLQTAMDGLQGMGLLPNRDHPDGGNYLGYSWADRMGVILHHEAEDVRRKRDLSDPPPPSRYQPPPEQLSRPTAHPGGVRRYGRDELSSWLDPNGKFHTLGSYNSHDRWAAATGLTGLGGMQEAFKKGWVRVYYTGKGLYAHNDAMRPNDHQKAALTDLAIENGLDHVTHEHGEDERVLWSNRDQLSRRTTRTVTLPKKAIRFGAHDSLPALLRTARQTPNDPTIHGVIADALDEAHPGNHVAELIRRQYGLGQHTVPVSPKHIYPFGNRSDRITFDNTVSLGTDGPFELRLGHRNEIRDAQAPPRWIVHATQPVPREGNGEHFGYAFEFPHEEAHLIPRMFPGAAEHISPQDVNGGDDGDFRTQYRGRDTMRNDEAEEFNRRVGG